MAEANFILNNSFNGDVTATNFSLDSSLLEELDTEFVDQKEYNNVRFRPPVSVDLISKIQDSTKPENTRKKEKWASSLFARWCGFRGEDGSMIDLPEERLDELLTRTVLYGSKEGERRGVPRQDTVRNSL